MERKVMTPEGMVSVGTRIRVKSIFRGAADIWGFEVPTVPEGTEGEITEIDGIGFLRGTWGKPVLRPYVDKFEIVSKK